MAITTCTIDSIVLISICVITENNLEQLKTTMSAEIQLFMKLCASITGYKMEVDFSKHFSLAK